MLLYHFRFLFVFLFLPTFIYASVGADSVSIRPQQDKYFWGVRDSQISSENSADFAFSSAYEYRPFQVQLASGPRLKAIEHRWMNTINFSGVFIPGWQVNVDIPFAVAMQSYDPLTTLEQDSDFFTIGDFEISAKTLLHENMQKHWSLAIAPFLRLPSGNTEQFMGTGNFSGGFHLISDCWAVNRWRFGTNLGLYLRVPHDVVDDHSSSGIPYGLAASYEVEKGWNIRGELVGSLRLTKPFSDALENPLDGIFSVQNIRKPMTLNFGTSVGLVRGSGTPYYRIFFGLKLPLGKRET